MTDLWRKYFLPAPDQASLADELLAQLPERRSIKEEIEWALSSPIHQEMFPEAMAQLSRMLPDRVWVVAKTYPQARNFGEAVRKRIHYVDDGHNLMGIDNIHIVFLGDTINMPNYRQIMGVLSGRRNVTRWDIREWGSFWHRPRRVMMSTPNGHNWVHERYMGDRPIESPVTHDPFGVPVIDWGKI